MIESTVKLVDGVKFYTYRIVPPLETRHGIPVERVKMHMHYGYTEEAIKALKLLGYKKVDYEPERDNEVWARVPHWWMSYRLLEAVLQFYWKAIRFLYDNARMFKQIPEAQRFSWRYFTPYTWFKKVKP